MIWFAAHVLGQPLDPWQQWAVIHLGELLPDGRPRFRRVLLLVARQNGKTHLCKVLALYWLFNERIRLILGTSTKLDYAAEPWREAVKLALAVPALARMVPKRGGVMKGKGEQMLTTSEDCRYKIGTADASGGRSLPVERLIGDELREQRDWDAYDAAYNAMQAQPHGQAVWISNMGDVRSVVLNSLRDDALLFIERGQGDERLGLFEYSAPPGAHPMDVHAQAAANPQLGRRMDYDTLRGAAVLVSRPGADPKKLAGFRTEVLCQAVSILTPAYDAAAWKRGNRPAAIDLGDRGRLAACVDVAPDLKHASLAVAVMLGEARVRVELVQAWDGDDALARVLADLPDWLAAVRPKMFGWFPASAAAALDATLRDRRKTGGRGWPPRGVTVQELQGETPAIVMGLGERITAGAVWHSGQALLDTQIDGAEQLPVGPDRWVLTRRGAGHVDAAYAAAGAVHLARTMPAPRPVSRRVHT